MEVLIIFLGILLLASCTTYHDFFPNFSPIHKPREINRGIPALPNDHPNLNYLRPAPYECVHAPYQDRANNMICGYDCQTAKGWTKCAMFPNERCLVASSGYIACGFDCKRSRTGMINCGERFGDTCVETVSGYIICGLNCRVECGSVVCEESPSFRRGFPMQPADTLLPYREWLDKRPLEVNNQFPPPNAQVTPFITCHDCRQ